MGLQQESFFWLEKANQIRRERVIVFLGPHERTEAGKTVFAPGIDRLQVDGASFAGRDLASRQDADRHIHRNRPRVKQVQRPQIECRTGQVGAAWGLSGYLVAARGGVGWALSGRPTP